MPSSRAFFIFYFYHISIALLNWIPKLIATFCHNSWGVKSQPCQWTPAARSSGPSTQRSSRPTSRPWGIRRSRTGSVCPWPSRTWAAARSIPRPSSTTPMAGQNWFSDDSDRDMFLCVFLLSFYHARSIPISSRNSDNDVCCCCWGGGGGGGAGGGACILIFLKCIEMGKEGIDLVFNTQSTTTIISGQSWDGEVIMITAVQDSRLLHYLIREIKTWLNINHIITVISNDTSPSSSTTSFRCPLSQWPSWRPWPSSAPQGQHTTSLSGVPSGHGWSQCYVVF